MYSTNEIAEIIQVNGSNHAKPVKVEKRKRVAGMSACYVLTSHKALCTGGYPFITRNGRNIKVSQYLYEHIHGPIEKGLEVSHLCEVLGSRESRLCINPEHLVAETRKQNLHRSASYRFVQSLSNDNRSIWKQLLFPENLSDATDKFA